MSAGMAVIVRFTRAGCVVHRHGCGVRLLASIPVGAVGIVSERWAVVSIVSSLGLLTAAGAVWWRASRHWPPLRSGARGASSCGGW